MFGGGRVMASLASSQVGDHNARFVLRFLASEGIRLAAQDLGDIYPRRGIFPRRGKGAGEEADLDAERYRGESRARV